MTTLSKDTQDRPSSWPQIDAELTDACTEYAAIEAKVSDIIDDNPEIDDCFDMPGFPELYEQRNAVLKRIVRMRARSFTGLTLKARLLQRDSVKDHQEPSEMVALSLAEDLAGDVPRALGREHDPALVAIARCQELEAEHARLHREVGDKADTDPGWQAERLAHAALWTHWREVVLSTVPTTFKGTRELSRFALGFVRRQGTGLDNDGEAVLELIAKSPAL